MAIPPSADDLSRTQSDERGRLEMERNWHLRQENVLPLETAWNEGRFYGLALKGSARLTGVQRVGILMVGMIALGSALAFSLVYPQKLLGPTLESIYHGLPDVPLLLVPVILFQFALGLRLCWVAIRRPPRSRHHAK